MRSSDPELLTDEDEPTYRCCDREYIYSPDPDDVDSYCYECGSALDWSEIEYYWDLSELYPEDPDDSEDPQEGDLFYLYDNPTYNYSMDNHYTPYQVYLSIE
jgi:hypothetical protein